MTTKKSILSILTILSICVLALVVTQQPFTILTNQAEELQRTSYIGLSPGWDSYEGEDYTSTAMVAFNSKIYEFAVKTNGYIYFRSFNSEAELYNKPWVRFDGKTSDPISTSVVTVGSEDRLYLSLAGKTTGSIYTRYLNESEEWSDWEKTTGKSDDSIGISQLNGNIFQFARGFSNKDRVYIRRTGDGVFDESQTEETWSQLDGKTGSAISTVSFNGRLYILIRGSTSRIFLRSTANGTTWSSWLNLNGDTRFDPTLSVMNDKLVATYVGTDQKVYTNISDDGIAWQGWSRLDQGKLYSRITSIEYGQLDSDFIGQDYLLQSSVGSTRRPFIRILSYFEN